ncbi:DNA polymerase III subunit chi [Neisseria iguanae]|uniref:DNA polymerase III subunit chi n=1 Tax=Neisseria iguanae TaxID=90242 RepID=A0A2P7U2E0_9NEIS|nr:DNA polymerase III subunit chi [Neisseria iguanae]PSJ81140.1 DNA polymerase III subunit chi [Neisseria iguanae]
MPKATFYTHVSQPAVFACRLAVRAVRDGGRVLVWSDSADTLSRLDRDWWQQDVESFIPHEIWETNQSMPSATQILLATGHTLPTLPADITILNLSPDFWPDAPQPPERVLEIIGTSLEDLAEARERFRAYRQNGFDIEHHKMEGKA